MKRVAIFGATSAIAMECARLWASEGTTFFLVGRNQEKLSQTADDLVARGASDVQLYTLDLNRIDSHAELIEACFSNLGQVDIALLAHGTLPDQAACERDPDLALHEFSNNALSVIALLTRLANRMEAQRTGTIAVISSVAGDRGRPSNYLYGTAKAAVSTFCQGLRARLFKAGVHVATIKPGFVDTPMTAGLNLPARLTASPEQVAKSIYGAIENRRNVAYTPWFWMGIMTIIKSIPEFLFKRANL